MKPRFGLINHPFLNQILIGLLFAGFRWFFLFLFRMLVAFLLFCILLFLSYLILCWGGGLINLNLGLFWGGFTNPNRWLRRSEAAHQEKVIRSSGPIRRHPMGYCSLSLVVFHFSSFCLNRKTEKKERETKQMEKWTKRESERERERERESWIVTLLKTWPGAEVSRV